MKPLFLLFASFPRVKAFLTLTGLGQGQGKSQELALTIDIRRFLKKYSRNYRPKQAKWIWKSSISQDCSEKPLPKTEEQGVQLFFLRRARISRADTGV